MRSAWATILGQPEQKFEPKENLPESHAGGQSHHMQSRGKGPAFSPVLQTQSQNVKVPEAVTAFRLCIYKNRNASPSLGVGTTKVIARI